jgi:hypothetical protein
MAEGDPPIARSQQKLVFASREPTFNSVGSLWLLILSATLVVAIYALAAGHSNAFFLPENAGTFVLFLFFGYILFRLVTRQWIAEIDLVTRRLRISQLSFGQWTKAIVNCPLEECSKVGTIEYNTDGHVSYGVYVELKRGTRHAIPLQSSTFREATRVASELTEATGIPRLDTKF